MGGPRRLLVGGRRQSASCRRAAYRCWCCGHQSPQQNGACRAGAGRSTVERNSGRGSACSGVVALTLKSRLREAGWRRPPLSAFLVLWSQGLAQGLARSKGLLPTRSSPRSLFPSRRALITLGTLLCFCKMMGQISRPVSDVDSQ